jgi:glycerate kinase
MRPGIELVLDLVELDRHLEGARAALTGEGSLDQQSLRGKAPVGVRRRAGARHVPTFAVAGVSTLSRTESHTAGFAGVYTLRDTEPDERRSLRRAGTLLTTVTEQLAREQWASPAVVRA